MRYIKVTVVGILGLTICSIATSVASVEKDAGRFRAACVKVDITPDEPQWMHTFGKRMSTGVLDHLFHKVVAMDDGQTQFFLISSDIIGFSAAYYDEFCDKLKSETGIKPEQVWWTYTHTHSSPSMDRSGLSKQLKKERDWSGENTKYLQMVQRKLLQAVKDAQSKLEPAKLGIGTGWSWANINRRSRDVDGKINLGKNPLGPVDRQINIIRIDRSDGSPIALIANYPLHGTVLGYYNNYGIGNTLISGDAPGVVSQYVEEKIGAPMLFIQGAAGNIAPIYTTEIDHKRGRLTEFKVLVGDKILEANNEIKDTTGNIKLRIGKRLLVESPLKEGITWPDKLKNYCRTTSTGTHLIRFPVSFLCINDDIVIWSAPCELFCEIAMNIRDASPFPHTYYFGYANGTFGYIPTRQAFLEGGYEPEKACPFTPKIEDDLTHSVISYIQSLSR